MIKAIIVEQGEDRAVSASVQEIEESRLPDDGDVDIAVQYSNINYKDGLCLNGLGGLVRSYPHVPGIDFAGEVTASRDPVSEVVRCAGAATRQWQASSHSGWYTFPTA